MRRAAHLVGLAREVRLKVVIMDSILLMYGAILH